MPSKSISFDPSITQMPSTPTGRSHILAIGIDKYQYLPQLRNAVKDAFDVTQILVSKYQFNDTDVTYLSDEKATQQNIFHAFRGLIRDVKSEDIVLIYFSGHGILQNDINEGYWIPVDGSQENPGSYVANSMIVNYLRNIKSLHTFVISDACFSGSMFIDQTSRDFAERQESIPSRWLMTSGRDTPVSDGKPGQNSPFANSVLLHLRENQREVLSVTALFRSVSEDVGNNYDQLPRCEPLQGVGHRGGEFALRLKGSIAPPPPPRPLESPVQRLPTRPFDWKRMALWTSGIVAVIATILMGFNYFNPAKTSEKAILSAPMPFVQLGKLMLGENRAFTFVISNVGNAKAYVNVIHSNCDFLRIKDTASIVIAPKSNHTYHAEWVGKGLLGQKTCEIIVGDSNFVRQAHFSVQAEHPQQEVATAQETDHQPPPVIPQKARLVLVGKTPIELGDIKRGEAKEFSFSLRNTSAFNAFVSSPVSSCVGVTVSKVGGSNIISSNTAGSYRGVWRANELGQQQQCTLTIGGSNLEQPVTIVVKASVKGAGGPEGILAPPTSTIRCLTHGTGGIKIWFYDYDGKKYEKTSVSGQDDVEFSIPQTISGKIIEVNYKRGTKEDHRDEQLLPAEPFEVPLGIRN